MTFTRLAATMAGLLLPLALAAAPATAHDAASSRAEPAHIVASSQAAPVQLVEYRHRHYYHHRRYHRAYRHG